MDFWESDSDAATHSSSSQKRERRRGFYGRGCLVVPVSVGVCVVSVSDRLDRHLLLSEDLSLENE